MEILKAAHRRDKFQNTSRFEYTLEKQVGHLLRRAYQRHSLIFMEAERPQRITAPQWAALYKLQELGSTSQNHLGRLIAMDAATMQGLAQRLIERGLILRGKDPSDKRRRLLCLTALGSEVVEQMVPIAEEITRITLEPLNKEEQESLLHLLSRLV